MRRTIGDTGPATPSLMQKGRAEPGLSAVPKPAAEPQVEIPLEKAAETAKGEDMAGETRAIDPVCGMSVDPATAEYRSFHDGKAYYFCSAGCKESFDRDPGRYTATASTGRHQHH